MLGYVLAAEHARTFSQASSFSMCSAFHWLDNRGGHYELKRLAVLTPV